MDTLLQLKQSGQQLNPDMHAVKDTVMWNPLHFSVYQGHLDIIKFLHTDIKINIGLTAPKNIASNEGE